MISKKKTILYVGNDLFYATGYMSSMETLSRFFSKEGYKVYKTSSKKNKLARILDTVAFAISHRKKIDYILIDTFSTKYYYYCLIVSMLSRILKLPYIPILRGGNLPYRLKNKFISRLIFSNSLVNVAPSNFLLEAFSKSGFKTIFIPNILELQNYDYYERKQKQPTLLWVRAFRRLYNPTMAIDVVRLLKKEYPSVKLCMVGPAKDDSFEMVKKKISDYDLLDSVEFTGVLPKEVWIRKSKEFSFFLNTTNFDNTPVSVMEAMALGLSIVSTNAGGMPYLIENNVNGVLVDKNDSEAMAKSIIQIIENNNSELSLAARKTAEEFSWEVVKYKWFQILN
tara:strand:+ start:42114 stop:43130 length:1017 start_codon:yes stop_codon:yes gene_type:complete